MTGKDTTPFGPSNRRKLLSTIGGVVTGGLAGCTDGDTSDRTETTAGGGTWTTASPETTTATESPVTETESLEDVALEFSHPDSVWIDEQFSLDVSGIPTETVDLELSMTDSLGTEWTNDATYEGVDGTLSLDGTAAQGEQPSQGVMDLVQFATPAGGNSLYTPARDGDTVTVRVTNDGETLGETTIDRTIGDPALDISRLESEDFFGWVHEPPGDDPAPGVITLHGSGGRPAGYVGGLLASHGFVTIALQYFDWGSDTDLPGELVEVPIEYVERAADWLLDHDRVSGSEVGVWGASKGGELALLSASEYDTIGPTVSVNGSGVVWEGIGRSEFYPGSSWTLDGEPVSYVPYAQDPGIWDRSTPAELRQAYTTSFEEATESEIESATVPVEDIEAPVLLVSGGDDELWQSVALQNIAADRLAAHDREVEHLVYDEAGHAIRFPYLPTANREEGPQYVFGGSQAGYAEADRDYWPRMIETFETLRE